MKATMMRKLLLCVSSIIFLYIPTAQPYQIHIPTYGRSSFYYSRNRLPASFYIRSIRSTRPNLHLSFNFHDKENSYGPKMFTDKGNSKTSTLSMKSKAKDSVENGIRQMPLDSSLLTSTRYNLLRQLPKLMLATSLGLLLYNGGEMIMKGKELWDQYWTRFIDNVLDNKGDVQADKLNLSDLARMTEVKQIADVDNRTDGCVGNDLCVNNYHIHGSSTASEYDKAFVAARLDELKAMKQRRIDLVDSSASLRFIPQSFNLDMISDPLSNKKTVESLPTAYWRGKRVLIWVDPVLNDTYTLSSRHTRTVQYLSKQGAKVCIIALPTNSTTEISVSDVSVSTTHALSVKDTTSAWQRALNKKVRFLEDASLFPTMRQGEIVVLENPLLQNTSDPAILDRIANNYDLLVNDALSSFIADTSNHQDQQRIVMQSLGSRMSTTIAGLTLANTIQGLVEKLNTRPKSALALLSSSAVSNDTFNALELLFPYVTALICDGELAIQLMKNKHRAIGADDNNSKETTVASRLVDSMYENQVILEFAGGNLAKVSTDSEFQSLVDSVRSHASQINSNQLVLIDIPQLRTIAFPLCAAKLLFDDSNSRPCGLEMISTTM